VCCIEITAVWLIGHAALLQGTHGAAAAASCSEGDGDGAAQQHPARQKAVSSHIPSPGRCVMYRCVRCSHALLFPLQHTGIPHVNQLPGAVQPDVFV
jgi:hypothetical protein